MGTGRHTMATPDDSGGLFPALTPPQRYQFEVLGYCLIPELLDATETAALLAELHELRSTLIGEADQEAAVGDRLEATTRRGDEARRYPSPEPGGAVLEQRSGPWAGEMDGLQNLSQLGGFVTGYAAHPKLVAMASELLGGEARLMQEDAIINRRPAPGAEEFVPGWHRGADVPFAAHTSRGSGLTHVNFIKALTNLTPLGPGDGGTLVSQTPTTQPHLLCCLHCLCCRLRLQLLRAPAAGARALASLAALSLPASGNPRQPQAGHPDGGAGGDGAAGPQHDPHRRCPRWQHGERAVACTFSLCVSLTADPKAVVAAAVRRDAGARDGAGRVRYRADDPHRGLRTPHDNR